MHSPVHADPIATNDRADRQDASTMTPEPVIVLDEVRKSYGRTAALRGVSLAIAPGEMVGLLGPNGAGKSTLFQIAAGLFAPDGGTVQVFGKDYRKEPSAILKRLGVVFQSRSLDLDMTARANLKFHGNLFGLSGALLKARIEEASELLEIVDLLDTRVRSLSGGNQRRVEIARALLNEPQLLLMDEPTVGLDANTRQAVVLHMDRVRRLKGTAILWSTHLVEEVEGADRIALLVKGEILRSGTPADIQSASAGGTLADAYIALTGGVRTAAD
jgi:ABC-2 type transport system ATP-binding protein